MAPEREYTFEEAHEAFGVAVSWLRRKRDRGELQVRQVNARRVAIAESELRRVLGERSHDDPLEELRAEVEELRRRVADLEEKLEKRPKWSYSALSGDSERLPALDVPAYQPPPPRPPVAARTASIAASATFKTHADAARWLARHGVNEYTPKTWVGWRDVELEPRAVLEDALARQDGANWRVTWRLHECADDPLCVCHELLPA